jgi:nucleotide-binding universal stress UspA family protein
VVLLNVQSAARHGGLNLDEFRQRAERILAEPRRRLDAAGIPYQVRIEFGNAGRSISKRPRKKDCSQIIMGARGADLLLGSVETNVFRLTGVPVTLVK